MSTINKVPASAGAEWLLAGFALLKRAPVPLFAISIVGLLVVALSLLVAVMVVALMASLPFPLSLIPLLIYAALTLGVPCLIFAGVVWAAREVSEGRDATVHHLQVGIRHVGPLLLTSVIPLAGTILSATLLIALIGTDGVQQANDVMLKLQAMMANGGQPDPAQVNALVASLPVVRFLFWMLVTIALAPIVVCLVMVAVSEVIFSHRSGFSALRLSLAANAKNFGALIVFSLLLAVLLFALSLVLQIVGVMVQFVLGPVIAVLFTNLALMGVLMPLLAGAAYAAWRQMLGGSPAAGASAAPTRIEV
jgi:hypothetical protein